MNRQQTVFVAVTLAALALGVLMVIGFFQYLLAGAILAFVTRPLQRRLDRRLPATAAAAFVVLATLFVAVLPVLVLLAAVADDVAALAGSFSLESLPSAAGVEAFIEGLVGRDLDLDARVQAAVEVLPGWAAGAAPGLLGGAAHVLVGLSLMLIVQFYLVRDWAGFAAHTREFDVLPTAIQDRVYRKTGKATWSVVKGHVFVAVLQGLAAGLGLWAVGIPRVFLLTFLMVILGFVPVIGTALVWVPAGLYLLATGSPTAGLALLVYGTILVGALDNLARPLLIDEDVALHDLFVLLGVIGGVSLFGPIGIFVGPVVYAVLAELLAVYRETYDELGPDAVG